MSISKTFTINPRLLPVKAIYFTFLAAVATLHPYIPIYMRHIGLSQAESGIIYGSTPFIGAFVKPAFGAIADKYQKHKSVLMFCVLLTGIFHASLFTLPHIHAQPEQYNSSHVAVKMKCDSSGDFFTVESMNNTDCVYEMSHCTTLNNTAEHFWKFLDSLQNGSNDDIYKLECTTMGEFELLKSLQNWSFNFQFNIFSHNQTLCIRSLRNECVLLLCPMVNKQDKKLIVSVGAKTALTNSYQCSLFVGHLLVRSIIATHVPEKECYTYITSHFDFYDEENNHDWVLSCETPINCTSLEQLTSLSNAPYDLQYGKIFWIFFFLYLISQIFYAPINSLVDGMAFSFLGEDGQHWGRSRLFGTLGYLLLGITSAIVMDQYAGDVGNKAYMVAFILFPLLNFISAVMVCFLNIPTDVKCEQLLENLFVMLKNPHVLVLLFIVMVFGKDYGMIETFLFWYLQDMGGSHLLLGLCMGVTRTVELFVLLFSGEILQKIGHINSFYIVFTGYISRMVLYSFVTKPWFVLLIEPLHGITFGLFYATAKTYGSLITPPGMHGTVQGLIGGLYFGIGHGIGSVCGGAIFNSFGAKTMFRGFAAVTTVVAVIYALLQVFCLKTRAEYTDESTAQGMDQLKRSESESSDGSTKAEDTNTRLDTEKERLLE